MNEHLRPWARRSLSLPIGNIATHGEPRLADALAGAFEASERENAETLTHGFHTWPARMHPALARELVRLATHDASEAALVLDPFMGGGTVLVEARVQGHWAVGVDLNPLAARVAAVRTDPGSRAGRAQLMLRAQEVARASEERVRTREPVVARLPRPMLGLYLPHVLKELAGLLEEIRKLPPRSRDVLEVVFSSLVVKLSRKKADTSDELVDKRIRKGLATEMFLRKCEELTHRWEELEAVLPARSAPPRLVVGDARELPRLLPDLTADAIVTSPPYGGTYDYHGQHALRLAWLGAPDRPFFSGEIGARGTSSPAAWNAELSDVLRAMHGVLSRDGRIVLVIGDGEVRGTPLPALPQLEALAPSAGLSLVAAASVERPDFRDRSGPPRYEHAVALRPLRRHRERPTAR